MGDVRGGGSSAPPRVKSLGENSYQHDLNCLPSARDMSRDFVNFKPVKKLSTPRVKTSSEIRSTNANVQPTDGMNSAEAATKKMSRRKNLSRPAKKSVDSDTNTAILDSDSSVSKTCVKFSAVPLAVESNLLSQLKPNPSSKDTVDVSLSKKNKEVGHYHFAMEENLVTNNIDKDEALLLSRKNNSSSEPAEMIICHTEKPNDTVSARNLKDDLASHNTSPDLKKESFKCIGKTQSNDLDTRDTPSKIDVSTSPTTETTMPVSNTATLRHNVNSPYYAPSPSSQLTQDSSEASACPKSELPDESYIDSCSSSPILISSSSNSPLIHPVLNQTVAVTADVDEESQHRGKFECHLHPVTNSFPFSDILPELLDDEQKHHSHENDFRGFTSSLTEHLPSQLDNAPAFDVSNTTHHIEFCHDLPHVDQPQQLEHIEDSENFICGFPHLNHESSIDCDPPTSEFDGQNSPNLLRSQICSSKEVFQIIHFNPMFHEEMMFDVKFWVKESFLNSSTVVGMPILFLLLFKLM